MVILQSCGYSSAMRFTLSINCWKRSCAGEYPTRDEACAGEAEPPCPLDRGSHPCHRRGLRGRGRAIAPCRRRVIFNRLVGWLRRLQGRNLAFVCIVGLSRIMLHAIQGAMLIIAEFKIGILLACGDRTGTD